jgi:hypothetical protein
LQLTQCTALVIFSARATEQAHFFVQRTSHLCYAHTQTTSGLDSRAFVMRSLTCG